MNSENVSTSGGLEILSYEAWFTLVFSVLPEVAQQNSEVDKVLGTPLEEAVRQVAVECLSEAALNRVWPSFVSQDVALGKLDAILRQKFSTDLVTLSQQLQLQPGDLFDGLVKVVFAAQAKAKAKFQNGASMPLAQPQPFIPANQPKELDLTPAAAD